MTVPLTSERSRKLKVACEHLYNKTGPAIREVADVVGLMVEIDKCEALRNNLRNFDAKMTLSPHNIFRRLIAWLGRPP